MQRETRKALIRVCSVFISENQNIAKYLVNTQLMLVLDPPANQKVQILKLTKELED